MTRLLKLWVVLAAALFLLTPARADLVLTGAGSADGFVLTTFATVDPGNTTCCGGPFGVANTSNGNVIVSTGSGNRYVFSDTDGQNLGTALNTVPSNTFVGGYANAGGVVYGAVYGGQYVAFNNDGTVNHVLSGVPQTAYLGMWGDPANGHIIAMSEQGLIDIDPLANGGTGSSRVIENSLIGDGVSLSTDGSTAYIASGQSIVAYDVASGAQLFSVSGFSNPDGTGVVSGGQFSGDIIVNNNNGEIDLLDPNTRTFVAIAFSPGGFRG